MSDEIVFWDCRDSETLTHTDPDEAIEEYLDLLCDPPYLGGTPETNRAKFPDTITVTGYKRKSLDLSALDAEELVKAILERLDEEYGDPDDWSDPTPGMLEAAQKLVETIRAEYVVWYCEPCENVEVDVEEWLAKNPEFLGEDKK